ncbi:hypothetical protein HI914_01009 [Erysiphe necator]|uniref:Putative fungal protein n=1 Tax=Uncinula necator TaxID=52586 RepID=A0A0B1PCC4_UNCNE|nr:hypothetical protein HI914_01009 [Erysiphe necator]KHJ35908.1 putative fungal protein [Erysiphe necator]
MAAPANITIKNLSGKWVMDKNKSTPPDPVLNTQGVGWAKRKAIGIATITLSVTQTVDDSGITHINIDQTATGGIPGTSEKRDLDWEVREHTDHVFGTLKGRTRWIALDAVKEPLSGEDYTDSEEDVKFLCEGWIEDASENGGPNGERHIDSFVRNESRGWTARQIWGFQLVDGARHYVRKVIVKKEKTVHQVTLIYDYKG